MREKGLVALIVIGLLLIAAALLPSSPPGAARATPSAHSATSLGELTQAEDGPSAEALLPWGRGV